MRIDYDHQLSTGCREVVLHFLWVREFYWVPCEIFFRVGVFYVQPHDVDRQVVRIEIFHDSANVILVIVVPTALMIRQGEILQTFRLLTAG